jgi:hypothetical protein
MFQAWLVKIAKIAASSGPSVLPRKSEMKKTTVKREVTENRHRLQDVEERYQHHLGAAALAGQGRIGARVA